MLDLTDHVMVLCWSVLSWHLKRTLHPRVLQSLCNLLDSCRGVQPFDIAKQCYQPPGLCCRTVQSSCQRKTWKGGLVGKAHSIQAREPNFRSLNPCFKKKKKQGMLGSQRGEDPWGFLAKQANRISALKVQWQRLSDYVTMWKVSEKDYIHCLYSPQAHACVCPPNKCVPIPAHTRMHTQKSQNTVLRKFMILC